MNEIRLTDIRKYENDLNFKGIDFPVKLKDIPKFENQNPNLPGINLFSVNDNNKIYPLRLSQKDPQKSIDLFLFSKDEQQHYSPIKNFSRLVRSQITSDTNSNIYICKKCLTHFTKLDLFGKHITYCSQNETVAVKMPTKNTVLNFQNHFKNFPFLLLYMQILNVSQNQLIVVNQIQIVLLLKSIKNMNQVVIVFI